MCSAKMLKNNESLNKIKLIFGENSTLNHPKIYKGSKRINQNSNFYLNWSLINQIKHKLVAESCGFSSYLCLNCCHSNIFDAFFILLALSVLKPFACWGWWIVHYRCEVHTFAVTLWQLHLGSTKVWGSHSQKAIINVFYITSMCYITKYYSKTSINFKEENICVTCNILGHALVFRHYIVLDLLCVTRPNHNQL